MIKLRARLYSERPDVIKHREEYNKLTRSHRTRVQKARREYLRYDVMMQLSNDDKPKCACCGLNEHTNFLALDHIAGRNEMDSEPELVKLGYSSKLKSIKWFNWLIENNFPKGFQILCKNCNQAKAFLKNKNQCPHEIMRKEEAFARMDEQSSFEAGF